jgi:peptidoglycan hydrolase-like protein with peptidoglycan-binding domain
MRIIGAALVCLAALWPVHGAAAPQPKPAAGKSNDQAKPAPGSPRAVYAAMPEHERMTIQADLIWTGDYNGIVDTDFGENSVAAVKTFQKRNGGKETGILNPDERAKLSESAHKKREAAGWRMVDDRATGARLGVPGKLAPQSAPSGSGGTRWQSSRGEVQVETFRIGAPGTTLASVFERMKKEPANRRPEYQVLKPDFFVVAGMQGGVKKFYARGQVKGEEVRGVTILYDKALETTIDRVVVAVSNAFAGFPSAQAAAAAPAARRPVEYATGIIVSKAGHIVTDRSAVEDCRFVVVPGFGNAVRVADDKGSDLALLQVFAARELTPAALAVGGRGSDVMLMGIADPEKQDGGSAVSSLKARVLAASGTSPPIEPMPALGFAGAAALDGDARLIGMVDVRASSAAMVPAEAIRTFLSAQSIAPANGPVSLDDAKAALVRVICVRK